MQYFVTVEGEQFTVEVDDGTIRVNGEAVSADLTALPGTASRSLLLDDRSHFLLVERNGGGDWTLDLGSGPVRVEVLDRAGRAIRELTRKAAAEQGPRPLRAPMPGMVVKVDVDEGEEVAAGQAGVVVEAMKMENELHAESEARVRTIHVEPGEAVEKDQVLVEFATAEEDEDG